MLEELREKVYLANMELPKRGLVTFTWGNASGVDREKGLMVIKPSGVEYEKLRPENMVVVSLDTGETVDGALRASSDARTHIKLYKAFDIGGIVHTHSPYATAWAQAGEDIPCLGTTHADYFYGCVPCTRALTQEEINADYEEATGAVIVETFASRGISERYIPAAVCLSHGPFAWGSTPQEAAYHAAVLEEVAKLAILTRQINPRAKDVQKAVLDKHFMRKHGEKAYYGQRSGRADK